jgi:hypothetical protein
VNAFLVEDDIAPLEEQQEEAPASTTCISGEPNCGKRQVGAGRPRYGWWQIHRSNGLDERGLWYCSLECGLTQHSIRKVLAGVEVDSVDALRFLCALSKRVVSPMDATPDRIHHLLNLAFKNLASDVEAEVAPFG